MQTNTKFSNIQNLSSLEKPKKLEGFTLPKRREIPVQLLQIKQFKKISDRPKEDAIGYPELLPQTCNQKRKRTDSEDGIVNEENEFETFIKGKAPRENPDKIYKCTKGMLWGQTTKNNYYRLVTCGKDWCSDCGAFHSYPHDRRIAKIFPRLERLLVQEQKSIQYLVITVPFKLRELFRNQEVLNKFRTYWRRKLKREGNNRGIMRWHWCGEDGYKWAPHLNILMEGGYLERSVLKLWRKELAQWFKNEFKLNYLPAANFYTSFTNDTVKLKHWTNYVLRATQTIWNPENEKTISKYKNTTVFGENWPPEIETEEEIIAKKLSGFEIDPETGEQEKIIWQKKYCPKKERYISEIVPIGHIRTDLMKLISRGFWQEPKYKPDQEPDKIPPDIKNPTNEFCLTDCPF